MPKPNPDLFSRELHFEVVPRCDQDPHGVEGDVVGMFNPPDAKNYVMEYVAVPADEFEIIKANYAAMLQRNRDLKRVVTRCAATLAAASFSSPPSAKNEARIQRCVNLLAATSHNISVEDDEAAEEGTPA